MSLLGMSFFYPTGDSGVASPPDNLCLADDGTPEVGVGNFVPVFPATCPYVTAVGATQLPAGSSVCTVGYYSPSHSILTGSYITGD